MLTFVSVVIGIGCFALAATLFGAGWFASGGWALFVGYMILASCGEPDAGDVEE